MCRDLLAVDVGANKGYLLAHWLDLWRPDLAVTPASLYRRITAPPLAGFVEAKYACGACSDCQTGHTGTRSSPLCVLPGVAAAAAAAAPAAAAPPPPPSLTLYAIEPVPSNVRILQEGLLAHVTEATGGPGLGGVALHVEALAMVGSSATTSVQFGVCPPGHEVCGVKREHVPGETGGGPGAYEVATVNVTAMTLDAWAEAHGLLGGEGAAAARKIDVLAVDTEGLDALVLAGGARLLAARQVRVLLFEYHQFRAWSTSLLEDVVANLDNFGMDCYLLQQKLALRLTGSCWHAAFEFRYWSNVMCVLREEEAMAAALAGFAEIPIIA